MVGFLFYMIGNALIIIWIMPIFMKFPNRVLIQCPACGSKLHVRPSTKRWMFVDMEVWAFVSWLVVWRHRFPVGIMLMLFVGALFAWSLAVKRLTHAYFMWRHPFRCQGGGHVYPVPQEA